MLSKRKRVGLAVVGFLCAGGVAMASGVDWNTVFGLLKTTTFTVDHNLGINGGPATSLTVTRGPLTVGLTHTLKADLTVAAADGLVNSMVIQIGTDGDSNGNIEAAEWTTVATAAVVESGGQTTASTPTITIASNHDGYRVLVDRDDLGLCADEVLAAGFTSEQFWMPSRLVTPAEVAG